MAHPPAPDRVGAGQGLDPRAASACPGGAPRAAGLGPAIVRAVVSGHGGDVTVAGGPGRTVFTVRLPHATVADPDPDDWVPALDAAPVPAGRPAS
jgi:hypothetical protein